MVRVNCSFKNMTWNIFAAGIPVRVWLLGCLGLDKNGPQVSIHPSNNLTLSVILSFFVSPSLGGDDRPVFTLSGGGEGVVEMRHWRHQPGNWGDLCQIFIKKTGLALAQHLIRKVENRVMILSGENFLGKTTGLKSIFVHSRSKAFWGCGRKYLLTFEKSHKSVLWVILIFTVTPQANAYTTQLNALKSFIYTYCTSKWHNAVTTLTLRLSFICLGWEQASSGQSALLEPSWYMVVLKWHQ